MAVTDIKINIVANGEDKYRVELSTNLGQTFQGYAPATDICSWIPSNEPKNDGIWLFQWLFQDEELLRGWSQIRGANPQCRIMFQVNLNELDSVLQGIPWELLNDSRPNYPSEILSISGQTPFSRFPMGKWPPTESIKDRPIKMLVAIANPTNLEAFELDKIDVKKERENIQSVLSNISDQLLKVSFLDQNVSLSYLMSELDEGYHILHLIAHGKLGRSKQTSRLYLSGDKDKVQTITSSKFAESFNHLRKKPHFIHLSSCESALDDPANTFQSLALSLIQAGIPAILAMQDRISQDSAQRFTSTFYRRLFSHGFLDLACNEGRARLVEPNLAGSTIPVLFSRLQNNRLFVKSFERVIPLQRPPRATHFTNRVSELNGLLDQLHPGQVFTLCGPGGIGKTALAVEALWQLAPANKPPERFPSGIVFYSFYGKPQKDLAVKAIAEAFGAGGHPNPLEATQKILQIRTALIVLDGTEEAEAGTLKQILDARGRCGILITSRTTKDAMTEWQNIVPLPTDEAVTLLAKWGQESISDNRVAQAICELVGYLPLAIRLAGHIVAPGRQSAVKFLQELQKTPLKKLHQGQRRQESVPLLLKQSLNQVTSQARQILTVSGILALAPFSPEVMVAATELSEAEIEDALEGLQDYGLLLKEGDHYHNRYQISHALIHTYANERLSADSTMFKRLVGYYAKLIEDESQDKLKGFQRLDMERSHIIQLISEGCKRQDWHGIRKLVWATQEYLSLRGYRIEQKQILDQCVRVVQHLGEQKTDKADLLNKLGEVCNALGKTKPALDYLKQALAIYETNDNPTGTASAKRSIGEVYISEAQPKPALDYLKQALAIYEINDNPTGIAFTKKGMGIACAMFGDEKLDDAVRLFNDALAICEELGDKNCIAANTGNLGNIHAERRQWIEAYKCFNVVLEFALSSGNRIQEGAALGNLGTIFFSGFEDMKMAHKRYKEALKIAIETSDLLREANLYYNIGEIHKYKQKYSKARKYLKKARKIFVKINACDGIKDCNDLLEELP